VSSDLKDHPVGHQVHWSLFCCGCSVLCLGVVMMMMMLLMMMMMMMVMTMMVMVLTMMHCLGCRCPPPYV